MTPRSPFNPPNPDVLHGLTKVEPPPPDSLHEKWCGWLADIDADLTDVAFTRYVWQQENELLFAHTDMPASDIFDVRSRNYATTQVTAVRRQIDTDKRSATLANLLTDLTEHPEAITKERYVGRAECGTQWLATAEFTRWADGIRTHLDPDIPTRDLAALVEVTDPIKAYVNKHVAHLDRRREQTPVPDFAALHAAIDALFEAYGRYALLLTGDDRVIVAPVPQYDMFAPYDRAWRVRA